MRRIAAIALLLEVLVAAPMAVAQGAPCAGSFVCSQLGPSGTEPATNGIEFVYRADTSPSTIVSNLRGSLVTHDGNLEDPDISASGEVVYERETAGEMQIFSTTRGQLTSGDGATDPSLNSLGEVVYVELLGGTQQVVSSLRGPLTAFGAAGPVDLRDPTIADSGRVVFSAHLPPSTSGTSEERNLWEIAPGGAVGQLTFFELPQRATRPTLAAASGELVYLIEESCEAALVSERDGTILANDGSCTIRAAHPDLGPEGELVVVVRGSDRTDRVGLVVRAGDAGAGVCSLPGAECIPARCDLDDNGAVDLVDVTILRRILAGEPLPGP